MREIKFRAWHKEQKKMYSAEEMGRDQLTLMPDGRGFANISGKDTGLSRIDDGRRMVPLQYTGLHDKNGKEIYEGDILATKNQYGKNDLVGQIAWIEKEARFSTVYPLTRFEVIGNIYSNPELLK